MYGNQTGGLIAAAVLGVSTANAGKAVPFRGTSARTTAGQIGRELAATGTNLTVTLAVFALVMLVAGLLLVTLSRRHQHAV